MPTPLDDLKTHLADMYNLRAASSVLNWDQRVYMPRGGAPARAAQLGTLTKLSHEMLVSPRTRDLLAAAEGAQGGDADSDDAAMLRVLRRDFDKATKVPTALLVELTRTRSLAEEQWAAARENNDYAAFAPWLQKVLELKRQYAAAIGVPAGGIPYDALLDDYEQGATAVALTPLLADLKAATVPLLRAIQARGDVVPADLLRQPCDEPLQEAFTTRILEACGYDLARGRVDRTAHPFCTTFSINDVRITTRYNERWFPSALFGCLHEMGHALYEMNVNPAYEATPLMHGASLGIHESQSRLWENIVGRSRPFWGRFYPDFQKTFPAFAGVPLEQFYAGINRVTPSLIRVEADELTYNLHIILRFELEQALLSGELAVQDAPVEWNARMKDYLGLTPPSDRHGILQDIHWSAGLMGYFPTYTLGNILASQLFAKASTELPGIAAELRQGIFVTLAEWLRQKVHQFGRKYTPTELIGRATGQGLSTEAYLEYLRGKYGEIYRL